MNTKKILLYAGGALVLGGVSFFVWSYFQKVTIPIGGTKIVLGSDSETNLTPTASNLDLSTPPIVAENSHSTSNTTDNEFYSGLDAFIRMGI
jgi:hypothetical protein